MNPLRTNKRLRHKLQRKKSNPIARMLRMEPMSFRLGSYNWNSEVTIRASQQRRVTLVRPSRYESGFSIGSKRGSGPMDSSVKAIPMRGRRASVICNSAPRSGSGQAPGGIPVLAILPTVNVPLASVSKGLGTGSPDLTLGVLTGTDLGSRNHVDFNYGIGRIAGGPGRGHFVQHLASISASRRFGENVNPYWEVYWISKQDPDGGHVGSTDLGMIYTLGSRFALDGGVDIGFTRSAPRVTFFGGFSVIIGEVLGKHGVHARQRKAQESALRRGPRRK